MSNIQPQEYDDPALPSGNRKVYGNVLDKFDNYTYNARLYMIPDIAASTSPGPPAASGTDERETTPSTSGGGAGGFINGAFSARPSQTYILAQTGVTGTQIDNIDISTVLGPGNAIVPHSVNFDIIQPGAADFLDQIVATKARLGLPMFANDVPIFLEIVFKGYTTEEEPGDDSAAGVPVHITGPYRYALIIKHVDLTINADRTTSEKINRLNNPDLDGLSTQEYNSAVAEMAKDEGSLDIIIGADGIMARGGITVSRYIETLLSMNKEFFDRITRRANATDPADFVIDNEKAFVSWFRVHTHVEILKYDYKRNAYAKKIVFKPVIYGSGNTTIDIVSGPPLNKPETISRVTALDIKKAYHYIFTGQNDQIINCDISYKAGISILTAPSGGITGDVSITNAASLNYNAQLYDDLTGETAAQAGARGANKQRIAEILNTASYDDMERYGYELGLNPDQILEAVTDSTSTARAIIVAGLANTLTSKAILDKEAATRRNTSSDNITNTDGTPYSPMQSGYSYSVDLLNNFSIADNFASEDALRQSQIYTANTFDDETARSLAADPNNWVSPIPATQSSALPQQTKDATTDGTPRNTLFGYISHQHAVTSFLISLNMQIRGDTWYLGKINDGSSTLTSRDGSEFIEPSSGTALNLLGNDVFAYFDMQAPRRFDQDVLDEDNNTGYWRPTGMAFFISGIYRLIKVVSHFGEGQFTQDLSLIKETGFQPNMISDSSQPTTAEQNAAGIATPTQASTPSWKTWSPLDQFTAQGELRTSPTTE